MEHTGDEKADVPAPEIDPEPIVIDDSDDERQRQEELARRLADPQGRE